MEDNHDREFHYFSQLPTELRLAIWRECLPRRVVEIALHFNENESVPSPCEWVPTSRLNRSLPTISRVCHESWLTTREASHTREVDTPDSMSWKCKLTYKNLRIDPSRDSVHLHWAPDLTNPFCHAFTYDDSALDCLTLSASRAQQGSFIFKLLKGHRDTWFRLENRIEALQKLGRAAVVMRTVVIHSTVQDAAPTGLFGLLGDAPIQLVEFSDIQLLDAFFDLAKKCESTFTRIRQDLRRKSPESIKDALQKQLLRTFGPEYTDKLSSLYPVIMFRLCPEFCHQPFRKLDAQTTRKSKILERLREEKSVGERLTLSTDHDSFESA
ncbi:hypothetical protein N7478_006578 [Penicillium angulare]|uniref:uncharacterized protein n=1 Tax=Penicillium angulare TaxID=116970 RepID=UPI002540A2D7|nr:uncharacterized protein N7478_006578 [Penicillium angulare]KAJ5281206.1 hypothetical protein N7478_006578 [Penicillium angulare]